MSKLKVFIETDKVSGTCRVHGQSAKDETIGKVRDSFRQLAQGNARTGGGAFVQGEDHYATKERSWDIVDKDDLNG